MAFFLVLFNPNQYGHLFQIVRQQTVGETTLMLGLFGLLGGLLLYCAWMAFDAGSSWVRTWQAHQWQRRHKHGFGIMLLDQGLAARLIDNIHGYNCFWLPRDAIADILWQRIREEGAKHSRWVYRTQLCYIIEHQGNPQQRWITLEGRMVKLGYPSWDAKRDRALFDRLYAWWKMLEQPQLQDDDPGL